MVRPLVHLLRPRLDVLGPFTSGRKVDAGRNRPIVLCHSCYFYIRYAVGGEHAHAFCNRYLATVLNDQQVDKTVGIGQMLALDNIDRNGTVQPL